MTATLNFTIQQGADFAQELLFLGADGNPLDFTGASAAMHIRRRVEDALPLIELTTANGRIVLGGADGTVTLTLPASLTTTVPKGGAYDFLVTYSGGEKRRLFEGTIQLSPAVTR